MANTPTGGYPSVGNPAGVGAHGIAAPGNGTDFPIESSKEPSITLKEEGVKIIYRNGDPIAAYKQNGTLKLYKMVEVTYADIAEIYDPKDRI